MAAVPSPKRAAIPATVARGGSRSAADSRVVAPTTWASEGPNMLSAVSSGDCVAR